MLFRSIMIIFPTNDVGKTGSLCKRMEKDPYLIPYTKVNSKWIKDLNMRLETVEHLEENIGKKLLDVGPGNDVLDMTPKAQATKGKIDKWDTSNYRRPSVSKGDWFQETLHIPKSTDAQVP